MTTTRKKKTPQIPRNPHALEAKKKKAGAIKSKKETIKEKDRRKDEDDGISEEI